MYEREKTIDVLRRLKAQENKPVPVDYKKPPVKEIQLNKEQVKIVNLPQKKIETAMQKIEELRKKMKAGSSNYFNMYYDLKNAEQEFLKEAKLIKEKNFQIPETTALRINDMMKSIKQNKSSEVKK